jgi:DNA-binding NarL/FixJ family response regulator
MLSMTDNETGSASEMCCSAVDVSELAAPAHTTIAPLTPREIEIVRLLAQGKLNKQVAAELGVSVRTIETHRRHVMQKLRIRSVVELVFYALDHGIVLSRS